MCSNKMLKAILIPLVSFYFLVLLQNSFLVHFSIFGFLPNFILVSVIIISFLAPALGIYSALFGGFFLDIFSNNFIGFNVLMLFAMALFIKIILKKYVRSPIS